MGAWGYNFFESDHDFDTISSIDEAAGLDTLESKAKKIVKQKRAQKGVSKPNQEYAGPLLSMYAGSCEDASLVSLVREHLEAGVLRKLIDERKAKMEAPATDDNDDDGMASYNQDYAVYEFVLLGACVMSLGCKIPDDFKELLIKKYRTTELQRDALHSIQLALGDGPDRYKDVQYDFGSKGLVETANSKDPEEGKNSGRGFVGLNVPAPFGFHRSPPVAMKEYPAGVCGGCGAEKRFDKDPLLCCGKCKVKKYCSKVCQQAHYKQHKRVCKEP
jgi:hypothetical protein